MTIDNVVDDRYDEMLKIRGEVDALIIAIALQDRFESHLTDKEMEKLGGMLNSPVYVLEEIDRKKGYRTSIINPESREILEIKYSFADPKSTLIFDKLNVEYSQVA